MAVQLALNGKIRNIKPDDSYMSRINAILASMGPEYGATIVSGGQEAKNPYAKHKQRRTGSTRHDVDKQGYAHTSDLVLTRNGKSVLPGKDEKLYADFIERAAREFPGIGHYDWGIHVGGGSEAFWGPNKSASSANPDLLAAFQRGRKATPGSTKKAGLDTMLLSSMRGSMDGSNPANASVMEQLLTDAYAQKEKMENPGQRRNREMSEDKAAQRPGSKMTPASLFEGLTPDTSGGNYIPAAADVQVAQGPTSGQLDSNFGGPGGQMLAGVLAAIGGGAAGAAGGKKKRINYERSPNPLFQSEKNRSISNPSVGAILASIMPR